MLSSSRVSRRLCSRCLGHLLPTAVRSVYMPTRFQSSGEPPLVTSFQRSLKADPLASTDSENELISSILLQRARAIAVEHKTLSAANAENYSIAAAKKLGELGPICATLKEWDQAHNVRLNRHSHYPI